MPAAAIGRLFANPRRGRKTEGYSLCESAVAGLERGPNPHTGEELGGRQVFCGQLVSRGGRGIDAERFDEPTGHV